MPNITMTIDASGGTDPGQTKLIIDSPETYVPPTYARCRELEASNSFGVQLNGTTAVTKYGTYYSQLQSMLTSIWTELNGEANDGTMCDDIGGAFGLQGMADRTGTPSTVKASGSFGFSTCFEPYDCDTDPDGLLYSYFKCRVEIPGPDGYDVRPFCSAVNTSGSSSDPARMAALISAILAHTDGIARPFGPTVWRLQPIAGSSSVGDIRLEIVSGTQLRVYLAPSFTFGQNWLYNTAPGLGTPATLAVTKVGSETPPYNLWPSSSTFPWGGDTIVFDEIDTVLTTTGGDYPHTYTISGGPTFGELDTSGTGVIDAGPRVPTLRDPGTPRGCPFHWEFLNRTPFGECETLFQLWVNENHKDSAKMKAPCECTIASMQEGS